MGVSKSLVKLSVSNSPNPFDTLLLLFPKIILWLIRVAPSPRKTPPPLLAVFNTIVLLVRVLSDAGAFIYIPPPKPILVLPEIVLLLTVSPLSTPP